MYSVAMSRTMLRLPSSSLVPAQAMATMKPIAASEALQNQEFWSKNKRLARPMSPHLTIYKPQLTSMLSISHRITGVAQSGILSGAALGVMIMPGVEVNIINWSKLLLISLGNFPSILNEIQQFHLGGLTIFTLKFILSVPVAFHFWNGFRYDWHFIFMHRTYFFLDFLDIWPGTWDMGSKLANCTRLDGLWLLWPWLQLLVLHLCRVEHGLNIYLITGDNNKLK